MSAIRHALEKLDRAVGRLESSAASKPAPDLSEGNTYAAYDVPENNVIDVDFLAHRIDRAIETVELLLKGEV